MKIETVYLIKSNHTYQEGLLRLLTKDDRSVQIQNTDLKWFRVKTWGGHKIELIKGYDSEALYMCVPFTALNSYACISVPTNYCS